MSKRCAVRAALKEFKITQLLVDLQGKSSFDDF